MVLTPRKTLNFKWLSKVQEPKKKKMKRRRGWGGGGGREKKKIKGDEKF